MRWLIALKRKDTSGLLSPGYPVKTATDKVEMAKMQQVKTATTIEEEEGREKKRREEEGRKIITQLSN